MNNNNKEKKLGEDWEQKVFLKKVILGNTLITVITAVYNSEKHLEGLFKVYINKIMIILNIS